MNVLRAAILIAWGLGLGVILVMGRYSLFIRAELWPLLLGTLVMFILFLVAMFATRDSSVQRRVRPAALLQAGMLLLPLLYMLSTMTGTAAASGLNRFAFQKRSLGATAGFDSDTAITDASAKSAATESPVQSMGYIVKHFRTMAGRHIITEGRCSHNELDPKDQATLFRFVVVCCAADAMPIQLAVKWPDATTLKDDCWLRVEGTIRIADQEGGQFPVIDATRVKEIPAPAQPYLSPYQR